MSSWQHILPLHLLLAEVDIWLLFVSVTLLLTHVMTCGSLHGDKVLTIRIGEVG